MIDNPAAGFTLARADFGHIGHGLVRPECVVRDDEDSVVCSDGRGGFSRLGLTGGQDFMPGIGGQPNGFGRLPDGSFVAADMGIGCVRRWHPTAGTKTLLAGEIDGVTLSCANHVCIDSLGRLWASFSSREAHWWPAAATPRPDGYVILLDETGARVVIDGLWFANELHFDAAEDYLYIAETSANRLSRFPVVDLAAARFGARETWGPERLSWAGAIDGFAFDGIGNVWTTDVVRNGLSVITPKGEHHVVYEHIDIDRLTAFEAAREAGDATEADLAAAVLLDDAPLAMPTSIAFAGPDRRTAVIGSLASARLATFRSPVAGAPCVERRLEFI